MSHGHTRLQLRQGVLQTVKHNGDEMNRKLHSPGMWPSRLLLVGMGLFGLTLFAQTPSDPPTATPAAQADKDKKHAATATAKKEDEEHRQPDLGVSVDSARKSDVLATSVTTEHNEGETAGHRSSISPRLPSPDSKTSTFLSRRSSA